VKQKTPSVKTKKVVKTKKNPCVKRKGNKTKTCGKTKPVVKQNLW
jgi:hypothetical protein